MSMGFMPKINSCYAMLCYAKYAITSSVATKYVPIIRSSSQGQRHDLHLEEDAETEALMTSHRD